MECEASDGGYKSCDTKETQSHLKGKNTEDSKNVRTCLLKPQQDDGTKPSSAENRFQHTVLHKLHLHYITGVKMFYALVLSSPLSTHLLSA